MLPLDGYTVIDMSVGIAGGYCTKLLADGGATVIKVESPEGDPLRRWSASGAAVEAGEGSGGGDGLHAVAGLPILAQQRVTQHGDDEGILSRRLVVKAQAISHSQTALSELAAALVVGAGKLELAIVGQVIGILIVAVHDAAVGTLHLHHDLAKFGMQRGIDLGNLQIVPAQL